jgi:hypothetical protein
MGRDERPVVRRESVGPDNDRARGTILSVAAIPEKAEIAGTSVFICPQDNLRDRPEPGEAGNAPISSAARLSLGLVKHMASRVRHRTMLSTAGTDRAWLQVLQRGWSGRGCRTCWSCSRRPSASGSKVRTHSWEHTQDPLSNVGVCCCPGIKRATLKKATVARPGREEPRSPELGQADPPHACSTPELQMGGGS